jgi:hypothetical protein
MNEDFELRPHGGLTVRNRAGDVVFWFKLKEAEFGPYYALAIFRLERADSEEKRRVVDRTFAVMRSWAAAHGVSIYNAEDLNDQVGRYMALRAELPPTDSHPLAVTVSVEDLVTGRRLPLRVEIQPVPGGFTVMPPRSAPA